MPEFRRPQPPTPTAPTSGRGFVGRGPKGYRRPDERIREDVSDQFTDDEWLDATDLTVIVRQGVIILGGTVPDRQQIRRAECIACSVSGVRRVANHIRVAGTRPAPTTDRGAIVPPGTREASLFQVATAPPIMPGSPIRPR